MLSPVPTTPEDYIQVESNEDLAEVFGFSQFNGQPSDYSNNEWCKTSERHTVCNMFYERCTVFGDGEVC